MSDRLTYAELERELRFLARAQHALSVTYDHVTRRPLFAHFRTPGVRGIDGGFTVEWAGEPDGELRAKEAQVRARLLLEEVREDVEHDRLPFSVEQGE